MTAPLAYSRVKDMLTWLAPGFPSLDSSTKSGNEMSAIAYVIARAVDRVDGYYEEMFPDGVTQNVNRWARIVGLPANSALNIAQKRNVILGALRRNSGVTKERIAIALAPLLDTAASNITFTELTTARIYALPFFSIATSVTVPSTMPGPNIPIMIRSYLPGKVDDSIGVSLTFQGTGSLNGTEINYAGRNRIAFSGTLPFTFTTRTGFLGLPAAGIWNLILQSTAGCTLTGISMYVSNTVDSASRFYLYAYAVGGVGANANFVDAQRVFTRAVEAQFKPIVQSNVQMYAGDVAGVNPGGR